MGAGGASSGGGGYGNAQKGRKASTPGTQIGFSEATKGTGSDPKEKVDTKEKSFGEKVGGTFEKIVSNLPSVRAVRAITNTVRRGRVNTSLMGTSDYQGSTSRSNVGDLGNNNGGDGGGAMGTSGQVVQAPQPMVAPTTAEVSQVTTTDAEDPLLLRKRKTLAKGRSLTIQTGPKGVSGDLTLGKPSLLGRA
jgi:hypothetical protein